MADYNWFTRVVVAAAIIQTLDSLHLKYPEVGPDKIGFQKLQIQPEHNKVGKQ